MTTPDDRIVYDICPACMGCGQQVEAVWSFGDRHFCEDCVRAAGFDPPGRRNYELREQIDWPLGSGLLRAFASALVYSLMIGFIVTAMFLAINVFFSIGQRQPFQQHLLKTIQVTPLFFGFSIAFISVVTIPMMLIFNWTKRPLLIEIDQDELIARSFFSKRRFPIHEMFWCVTTNASDMSGFYWPSHRLIQITHVRAAKQVEFVVCGFTDEAFQMWSEFFTLMKAKSREPTKLRVIARHVAIGCFCGSVVGVGIGTLFGQFLPNPMWVVALGFLGFIDGGLVGILNANLETGFQIKENWTRQFGKGWQGVVIGGLTGALLGFKCGIIAGWQGVAVCSSLNAVFCGFLMTHFGKRLAESDHACQLGEDGPHDSSSDFHVLRKER